MCKKSLIISLNYNPGHFSHLIANYKLLEEIGYEPTLYIHDSFNKMDALNEFRKINNISKTDEIEVAIFWFPSLKNILTLLKLKIKFKTKIIYVYHEPFESFKKYYLAGFGILKILKIYLINLVNKMTAFSADTIILPSQAAFNLYKSKSQKINSNFILIPLIFTDELENRIENKIYISYIGTIAEDHAFKNFIDFIIISIKQNWLINFVFLIATRSNLPKIDADRLKPYFDSKRLTIIDGKYLSNVEINKYYNSSLVVWNAYNRSMQSGVLPKAYMFGTAVIIQRKNRNEFVEDHKTCVLINDNSDSVEIKEAIEEIILNRDDFQKNCRNKFLSTFHYRVRINEFKKIVP